MVKCTAAVKSAAEYAAVIMTPKLVPGPNHVFSEVLTTTPHLDCV